jgi:hypothetical protein
MNCGSSKFKFKFKYQYSEGTQASTLWRVSSWFDPGPLPPLVLPPLCLIFTVATLTPTGPTASLESTSIGFR